MMLVLAPFLGVPLSYKILVIGRLRSGRRAAR